MPVWEPRPEWLLQAVDSALGQRGCELELVVVDDGCPEPVKELLAGIADSRLRTVRVEHGGVNAARNAGVAAARGDLLRFVDADDLFELDSTSHLLELTGTSGEIAYGATLYCDEELRPDHLLTCDLQGDVVPDCLLARFSVTLPALLFPRRIVEAVGPWDVTFGVSADWDYVLRATEHAWVRGDRQVAIRYRRHLDSISARPVQGQQGAELVVQRYFERNPEQRGTRTDRLARAMLQARAARAYAAQGARAKAVGGSLKALALDPPRAPKELRQVARVLRPGGMRRAQARRGHRWRPL